MNILHKGLDSKNMNTNDVIQLIKQINNWKTI